MNEKAKGVSERARVALNVLAVAAIQAAQGVNQGSSRVDTAGLGRALDEIEARVVEARREIGSTGK